MDSLQIMVQLARIETDITGWHIVIHLYPEMTSQDRPTHAYLPDKGVTRIGLTDIILYDLVDGEENGMVMIAGSNSVF